ncbi:hypothetical protein JCM10450v2_004942 [Rhodotorula kratochvilovae]
MATPAANPPAPSPAPRLVSSSVEGGFDIRFSWTLDFNILEPPKDMVKLPSCKPPLAGSWRVGAYPPDKPDQAFEIAVFYEGLAYQRIASSATVDFSLHWVHGVEHGRLWRNVWTNEPVPDLAPDGLVYPSYLMKLSKALLNKAASESGGTYDPVKHRRYRVDFRISGADPTPRRDAEDLVKLMPCLSLEPHPDIRLFFPRFGEDGAELWTTRELLATSSRYLETLLDSEFVESIPIGSKRPRVEPADPVAVADPDAKDFEDSDDETDGILLKQKRTKIADVCDTMAYNQITVTKTAYSTYRAVLVFLQTRFIRFAPLSSACQPNNPTARATRGEQLTGLFDKSPAIPVSPKSAYRLAHLLELEDLQRYCLDALRKGLSVDGAAHELFSDVSACYDAWRAVILEYVAENWDEVSKTPSWLAMVTKLKAGEMPSMAGVAIELVEAREKRKG